MCSNYAVDADRQEYVVALQRDRSLVDIVGLGLEQQRRLVSCEIEGEDAQMVAGRKCFCTNPRTEKARDLRARDLTGEIHPVDLNGGNDEHLSIIHKLETEAEATSRITERLNRP